jgi:hypothetical protein
MPRPVSCGMAHNLPLNTFLTTRPPKEWATNMIGTFSKLVSLAHTEVDKLTSPTARSGSFFRAARRLLAKSVMLSSLEDLAVK